MPLLFLCSSSIWGSVTPTSSHLGTIPRLFFLVSVALKTDAIAHAMVTARLRLTPTTVNLLGSAGGQSTDGLPTSAYYPVALTLFRKVQQRLTLLFLQTFPTPQEAMAATSQQIRAVLKTVGHPFSHIKISLRLSDQAK
jgi:hypothetical protein